MQRNINSYEASASNVNDEHKKKGKKRDIKACQQEKSKIKFKIVDETAPTVKIGSKVLQLKGDDSHEEEDVDMNTTQTQRKLVAKKPVDEEKK